MFIGHYGLAFAAKRVAPRTSLGVLTFAAQFLDELWPILLLLGVERVRIIPGLMAASPLDFVYYPFSHSLLTAIIWGILIGAAYYLVRRDRRAAWVVGLLVVSHWFLDLPVHRPDLPLWPGAASPKVGWGLWNSIAATYMLEFGIYAAGIAVYLRTTRARDRIGSWGLWVYVLVLAIVYVTSNGSPPPNAPALAWVALGAWLFVPWAWWVDKHRNHFGRLGIALGGGALGTLLSCTPMPGSTPSRPAMARDVARAPFGRTSDGRPAELFTLTNANGVELRVTNYGGIITSLKTPDRSGRLDDIVLGYESLSGYLHDTPYFGAIVGRYGNRIADGRFTLDGTTYRLAVNNGPNSLHGGLRGFDKVVWTAEPFRSEAGVGITLDYTSADMEEGYPGNLRARVTYTLTDDNRLIVDYQATTDKATPVNLTQHSYWNLAGDGSRDILAHVLTINADAMTPVDTTLIPTGEISLVAGTPFDFRTPMPIGAHIDQRQNTQIRYGGGYDHNFVLKRGNAAPVELVHAARVIELTTGRTLDIFTTEPGIQFYSGNFLDGSITGKAGRVYHYRYGLALETQHYPDSPNHPSFPSTILRPGQQYRTRTIFQFGVAR
jgi:aldose 1-epimerase